MKKRLKIGLLVEGPEVTGGIQTAARRHARLLSEELDVLPISFETTRREDDWAGRLERLDGPAGPAVRVCASDLKADNSITSVSTLDFVLHDTRYRSFADGLIDAIRAEGLDMLHAFGLFDQRGLLAAFAAAKCGIPYILSFRGVDLESRVFDPGSLPAIQAALPAAQAVVCVSEDSHKLVRRMLRPACPSYVVRNSLDPSQFEAGPVSLPLLENRRLPLLGCFGKFRRVTGLDFLLRAFARLNERRPALLLLGGSVQKRELEYYNRIIDSLPCAGNVIRVGHVPHARIPDYLRLCDAVVVPSTSDACPNKVLEAMHARVPLVATTAGGIPELVEDGRDALLVPPRSAEALAGALETVLGRPDLARRLAASAYARVRGEFAPERERERWLQVYRRAWESFIHGESHETRLPA